MKLFGNSELYAISENKGSENGTSETPSNTVASTTVAATSNGKMTTPVKSGRAANRSAPLSCPTKFGFSLGHFFNDMSSSVWFSYSLLFFKLYFSNSMAGALILIGQVADALATPFVGKSKFHLKNKHLLVFSFITFSFAFNSQDITVTNKSVTNAAISCCAWVVENSGTC